MTQKNQAPRLTLASYEKLGQIRNILARFLEERLADYEPQIQEPARNVLKTLVAGEGTRLPSAAADIAGHLASFGGEMPEEALQTLLRQLVADRILREDPDRHLYELRHDALAQQIRQWFSGLEQELAEFRLNLENRLREHQRRDLLLDADFLKALAPYESRLGLRGEMADLVAKSKAEMGRRRRLRQWIIAGVTGAFVLVVAVFGGLSYRQMQEAERQKEQAQANFQKARQAVDEFFTSVSEDILLNQPAMEPLRKELLEKALKYYEELSRQRTDDPKMRKALADAAFRVGNIKRILGDNAGTLAAYRRAIEIQESLVREYPEVSKYQSDLASSHNNLGALQSDGGDAAGAKESYRKAVDIRERLVREHPEVPQYQSDLAGSHYNLGWLQYQGGDAVGARESFQKAVDGFERLVREHPDIPEYQQNLARARNDLASSLGNLSGQELLANHPQVAIGYARRALELAPEKTWIKTNLAHGLLLEGQYAQALAIYTENRAAKIPEQGNKTFAELVLDDFKQLRSKGVKHPDMAKIEKLMRGGH